MTMVWKTRRIMMVWKTRHDDDCIEDQTNDGVENQTNYDGIEDQKYDDGQVPGVVLALEEIITLLEQQRQSHDIDLFIILMIVIKKYDVLLFSLAKQRKLRRLYRHNKS